MRIIIISFLFIFSLHAFAQKKYPIRYMYFEPAVHVGKPLLYSDSLSESISKPYSALDLRIGIYARGKHKQDYFLRAPSFGVGFYIPQYNSDTIGDPLALYTYFSSPFVRTARFSFNWEIGIGLGWRFNEFNPVYNPKNDLLGSDKNLFGNLKLSLAYMLTRRMELTGGVHLSHFSNGALNMPNKGFNMIGSHVGLKYHIATKPEEDKRYRPIVSMPTYGLKAHELNFIFASGTKTTLQPFINEQMYYTGSVGADYYYQYHWVGAIGGGVEFLYDGSLQDSTFMGNSMLGIHAGHEVRSGGMSLVFQIGTYLWKGMDAKDYLYMRTGMKKNFGEHFFASFTLKTLSGFRADYLELSIGYRIIMKEHHTIHNPKKHPILPY